MAYTRAEDMGGGMYRFTDDADPTKTVTLGGKAASDKAAALGALPAAQTDPTLASPNGLNPDITRAAIGAPAPVDLGAETTKLSTEDEQKFQTWAKQRGVRDVDSPMAFYDYRGAYQAGAARGGDQHWTDEFKQHGHPSFSVESNYSKDRGDGGSWVGDKYVPGDAMTPGKYQGSGDYGLSPDIAAAAGRGPDQRTAKLTDDDVVGAVKGAYGKVRSAMDAGAAREAQRGNFSGTPNEDARIAAIAGVEPPGGKPKASINLPDQTITADTPAVDPSKVQMYQGGGAGGQPAAQNGGKVVPGEWVPRTMQVQKGEEIPEATKLRYDRAGAMENNALEDQKTLAKDRAAQELAVAQGQQQAAVEHEADQRRSAAEQKAAMQRYQDRYEQMADRIAQQRVDPDKFWADKSQSDRIGIAVAQGVGAMVGAYLGTGKNDPGDAIDKAVNRNIEAQKANMEAGRAGLDAQHNLIGMVRANFDRQDQQDAATRALAYKAVEAKMATIATQFKGPEQQAAFQKLQADVERKRADTERQLAQATADHVVVSQQYAPAHVVGGPEAAPFAKNDGSFLDIGDGVSLKASNPEMAGQWRQQLDGIAEINDAAAELRAELAKGPSASNTSKVKMLVNNIATSLGAAKMGSARMTGQGELENIAEILKTGDHVTSDVMGRTGAALEAVEATAKNAHRRIVNSAPRYSRPVETKTGDLVRFRLPNAPQQRNVQLKPVE